MIRNGYSLVFKSWKETFESIRHLTVVRDRKAELYFSIDLYDSSKAIKYALKNEAREFAGTKWYDSVSSGGTKISFGGEKLVIAWLINENL